MSFSRVQTSDGATLSVKILGDDDRSKSLLTALHKAPGLSDHKEPETSYKYLQSQFRVLVYDARGSRTSDLKEPYNDERWAADVEEVRQVAGSKPSRSTSVVLKHSGSGQVLRKSSWRADRMGAL